MISPELLRRYPFFRALDDTQLKTIAMLAEEVFIDPDQHIFEADQAADRFYFLITGSIDLFYITDDASAPDHKKSLYVGHLNPEEPFGISALIEPYRYSATAITNSLCRIIKIEGNGLREMCKADVPGALTLMSHIAQIAMSRLNETRVQLAAAYAHQAQH